MQLCQIQTCKPAPVTSFYCVHLQEAYLHEGSRLLKLDSQHLLLLLLTSYMLLVKWQCCGTGFCGALPELSAHHTEPCDCAGPASSEVFEVALVPYMAKPDLCNRADQCFQRSQAIRVQPAPAGHMQHGTRPASPYPARNLGQPVHGPVWLVPEQPDLIVGPYSYGR